MSCLLHNVEQHCSKKWWDKKMSGKLFVFPIQQYYFICVCVCLCVCVCVCVCLTVSVSQGGRSAWKKVGGRRSTSGLLLWFWVWGCGFALEWNPWCPVTLGQVFKTAAISENRPFSSHFDSWVTHSRRLTPHKLFQIKWYLCWTRTLTNSCAI